VAVGFPWGNHQALSTPTILHCDNQSAISLSKDGQFHVRTKHIDFVFHFIREAVTDGMITLNLLPDTDHDSGILTKPLSRRKMGELTKSALEDSPSLKGSVGHPHFPATQRLGEYVRYHGLCQAIDEGDHAISHSLANEVKNKGRYASSSRETDRPWTGNCGLVVAWSMSCGQGPGDFPKESPLPQHLLGSVAVVMYSASVVDSTTRGCFFELRLITPHL